MTIVIVEDNYRFDGNGASVSTKRFREELIKLGHTVRVVGIGVEGKDMYGIEKNEVPFISKIAIKNNMRFGKFDKEIVTKAFEGADLVHIIFPWKNGQLCNKLAKSMGIPVTAAFHVQPQNMTYYMRMNKLGILNSLIFFVFKKRLYGNVDNIHCPSDFTARELTRHNYKARLHVISNGILGCFTPLKTPIEKYDDVIHILMTGRLSHEKRQFLLIKAVMNSKYKNKIQLHFVGRGPRYEYYKKLGSKLPLAPKFYTAYVPRDELITLIQSMDLYVHTSEVELEGLACMEAISCGKVPVIANSKTSATPQFALDNRSLFKEGKYLDLRNKIDYWIEHPKEREQMEKEYAKLGSHYNISNSSVRLEKMFKDAIRDHKVKTMIRKDKKLKDYYCRVERNNHIKEFFCGLFYFIIAIPILRVINFIWFGLRMKNRLSIRKIKKTGAVVICNHVHELDSAICAVGIPHRKITFVSKPSNFSLKGAGLLVDALGSVPTPTTPRELNIFINSVSKRLRKRKLVLFFPEGELKHYDYSLRRFQRGAFHLAVDARVPVLPLKILYREPSGILRYIRKKPMLTLAFGEPLYHNDILSKNEAVNELKERAENIMAIVS